MGIQDTEIKVHRIEICQELLTLYGKEDEAILDDIVAGDKTWVHN